MNTGFIVFIKKNCSVYQAQPVAPIFLWVHLSRGKLFLSPSTEIANKVLAFLKVQPQPVGESQNISRK